MWGRDLSGMWIQLRLQFWVNSYITPSFWDSSRKRVGSIFQKIDAFLGFVVITCNSEHIEDNLSLKLWNVIKKGVLNVYNTIWYYLAKHISGMGLTIFVNDGSVLRVATHLPSSLSVFSFSIVHFSLCPSFTSALFYNLEHKYPREASSAKSARGALLHMMGPWGLRSG